MQIKLVAKTLVVNSDNEILVLRRHDNDDYRAGEWDLPGGQADAGEDPRDAAIREAKEETGLNLSRLQPVHITSHLFDDCQVVKTIFVTTSYDGDVVLSFEHSDQQWLPYDELEQTTISDDYKQAARMIAQSQPVS